MRSIFAAALPLVAQPLFNNLGVNYACTLLGCIAVVLGSVPFLFFGEFVYSSIIEQDFRTDETFLVFGPRLRAMSKFAASDTPKDR